MAKPKAEKTVRTYALGPQPNGSIVLKIDSDFELMILRKAVEKQEKNSVAAGGTLSALAEGEDPFLDSVQRTLAKLKNTIARARAPENQIADTPIGRAIADNATAGEVAANVDAAARGEKPEAIDGHPDGAVWSAHVPAPRPKLSQPIVHPGAGTPIGITEILGWDPSLGAFNVKAGNAEYGVVAHEPEAGKLEWRINNEEYATPRVYPTNVAPGNALLDEAAGSGSLADEDPLTADAPASAEDADIVDDTDESGEPRKVRAPAKRAAKKATPPKPPAAKPAPKPAAKTAAKPEQRARNMSSSGVGARGKRPGGKK